MSYFNTQDELVAYFSETLGVRLKKGLHRKGPNLQVHGIHSTDHRWVGITAEDKQEGFFTIKIHYEGSVYPESVSGEAWTFKQIVISLEPILDVLGKMRREKSFQDHTVHFSTKYLSFRHAHQAEDFLISELDTLVRSAKVYIKQSYKHSMAQLLKGETAWAGVSSSNEMATANLDRGYRMMKEMKNITASARMLKGLHFE